MSRIIAILGAAAAILITVVSWAADDYGATTISLDWNRLASEQGVFALVFVLLAVHWIFKGYPETSAKQRQLIEALTRLSVTSEQVRDTVQECPHRTK
jgi:hypothetical protein